MTKNCFHCGRLVSLKPGSGTLQFDTKDEWRKEHPDRPTRIYLCKKCGENEEVMGWCKSAPWYAGYRVL